MTARHPLTGMRAPLAVLCLCLGVALAALACDAAPERSALPTPAATFDRTLRFHADGSIDLEGSVVLTLTSDHLERGYALGEARVLEPESSTSTSGPTGPRWEIVAVESDGPWPMFLAAGNHAVARLVTVRARVPAETATTQTSTVPVVPPSTLELTVLGAGPDAGTSQLVAPILVEDNRIEDVCPPPELAGMAAPIGAALDWSAATLPGLVADVSALAADPLGRAYLVGTYPREFGGYDSRVFAAKGGLIQSITEVSSSLVAIAPGGGAGPTLAIHDAPPETAPVGETHAVVVSRRDTGLAEIWSQRIASTGGLLLPAVATSGGRVLVGASVTTPLTIGGVEVAGADPSAYQLLLFDADTGALVASKGGIDAVAAVGLADGAFGIADASGFVRVLEADLSERWSVEGAGSIAASGDGLWTLGDGGARNYDASGDLVAQLPNASVPSEAFRDATRTLAPLPDGSVLIGTDHGVARASAGGETAEVSLPYAKVGWCSARPKFLVASAKGGAVIAARPETPQDGASPGRGVVARLTLLP